MLEKKFPLRVSTIYSEATFKAYKKIGVNNKVGGVVISFIT